MVDDPATNERPPSTGGRRRSSMARRSGVENIASRSGPLAVPADKSSVRLGFDFYFLHQTPTAFR